MKSYCNKDQRESGEPSVTFINHFYNKHMDVEIRRNFKQSVLLLIYTRARF